MAMKTLDLLETVIVNLSSFADLEYVKQLYKLVCDSEYSHLSEILMKLIKYYEVNGIFPSKNYWVKRWKAKINVEEEFLIEYASEIIARLRTEIVWNQVKDIVNTKELPSGNLITAINDCLCKYTPEKVNKNFDEKNLAESLKKTLDKKKERGAGLLTYTSIDKYTYGCPFGQSTVIGAPPKSGKSAMAMSTAWGAISRQNLKGIYISLEISAQVIYERLFSRYMYDKGVYIDNKDIIKGTMSEKDEKLYLENLKDFQEFVKDKLCVVTQENLPELSKMELEAFLIKKDIEMGGIDFVIVDQVSLLKYFTGITTTSGSTNKTFDIINAYIRYFTIASFTLFQKPVAMILLSQVKRDYYNTISKRKPIDLDVFAESSEIERSSNIALVLRSDDQLKASNLMEIVLVVNRDGDNCTEYTPNIFIPQHCYIGSLDDESAPNTQDIGQSDTSSMFNFMESVGEDEELEELFK